MCVCVCECERERPTVLQEKKKSRKPSDATRIAEEGRPLGRGDARFSMCPCLPGMER